MPCYSTFLSSLFLSSILFTSLVESFNNGGITLDLYRHSPSTTRFQRLRTSFARKSLEAPIIPRGGDYLMKFKIGTPPVEHLGVADTGSDLTWIQCKPCKKCFNQTLPLFDPTKTSSYRPVSCHSDEYCEYPSSCGSRNTTCEYKATYGGGIYSKGELAFETLTFDGGDSFPKVAFGCGHDNDLENSGKSAASGIVGLGASSNSSIVNQLQSAIKGKFSYCLTLLDSNATSKISFGSNAIVAGPKAVSTPLVNKFGSDTRYYYLSLEGMSVGTKRLDINGTEAEEGNIIIDSGTDVTFVPEEISKGVESAVEKAITRGGGGATRVSVPQGEDFSMCYKKGEVTGGFSLPPITAHFKGADLVLPKENIFVEVGKGILCLTLLPAGQYLPIFGNLHQMNYHVGYDLVKQQVSFLPTDCSKPY